MGNCLFKKEYDDKREIVKETNNMSQEQGTEVKEEKTIKAHFDAHNINLIIFITTNLQNLYTN